MNPAMYLLLFLPLLIILLEESKNKKIHTMKNIASRRKDEVSMKIPVEAFIGKRVLIYTFQSTVTGKVLSTDENWLTLMADNGQTEIINGDFITRVREYPKNKKGKDKSIVMD